MIRKAKETDAHAIALIYNHYIVHSTTTFEEKEVNGQLILERLNKSKKHPWWVYEQEGVVLGYAFSTKWKPRSAYRFTVESSVYVAPKQQQKGIGTLLYSKLINALKKEGFRIILAGISLPNDQSISFHEKLGFQKVGQLKSVGYKFNRWIDVGYWELKI
jgi:phosphinothricin acetyltransferase|tara:strand:+ start:496 stop:975 length:480 start_codon:yes stop_codon:yes gene_type:complete